MRVDIVLTLPPVSKVAHAAGPDSFEQDLGLFFSTWIRQAISDRKPIAQTSLA